MSSVQLVVDKPNIILCIPPSQGVIVSSDKKASQDRHRSDRSVPVAQPSSDYRKHASTLQRRPRVGQHSLWSTEFINLCQLRHGHSILNHKPDGPELVQRYYDYYCSRPVVKTVGRSSGHTQTQAFLVVEANQPPVYLYLGPPIIPNAGLSISALPTLSLMFPGLYRRPSSSFIPFFPSSLNGAIHCGARCRAKLTAPRYTVLWSSLYRQPHILKCPADVGRVPFVFSKLGS